MTRHRLWLACTALTVLAAPTAARAQSVWNGGNTNWFDQNNWSTNAVPGAGDNVVISTTANNPVIGGGGAALAGSVRVDTTGGSVAQLTVTGAGTTLNNAGAMIVGDTSTGTLIAQSGAALASASATIGNSGTGQATLTGAGTSWTNTGSLSIGNNAAGTLNILNGATLTSGGAFAVLGANTPAANGTVMIDGAGSRWTNNSDLIVGVFGSGTITVRNGGSLTSFTGIIGNGLITGSGLVTVTGAGSSWTTTGQMTVSSSTSGTLNILAGGVVNSVGSIIGDTGAGTGANGQATIDGANSRWTTTGNLTIGNQSGATGAMTLSNGGTAAADAVRIGQFASSTGTLNIGAASGATAAAPGTLTTPTVAFGAGTGRIVFNHTASSYDFTPLISGAGSLLFEAGTTTLTANNTYTGATTVNGGTLRVNGAIVSATTVNAGGTLGGSGTVGNTTISGGTLSPGNSIGTLNVQGNLVFTSASAYLVEVDPSGADRTNVSGTATLGGATVRATFAAGSYVTRRYTILNATGGVAGAFSTVVNTNLPANFTTALSYDPNNAYLDITLTFTPTPPGPTPTPTPTAPNFGAGLSGNQRNVAGALINSFNTAGGIPLVFGTLTAQGLTQVSGESATGIQQTTFNAMDSFMNMITDPFMGTRGGGAPQAGVSGYADGDEALAYAAKRQRSGAEREAYAAFKAPPRAPAFAQRWSVWGAGYGGTQKTDGNAATGSNDVTSRIYGGAAGFDYRLTPDTLVGFSLGGAGTNYGLANGLGGGRSEMFQAGVYGRHTFGAAYLAGALAYGWQDVTTDRTVLGNVYRANFDANSFASRLEGGYRFAFGASGVTPYAAGQFTTFWLPAYAEQTVAGANMFALGYGAKDVTASRTELGLRGDTSFVQGDAVVTLRGRAAWAHNFNIERSIGVVFQTLPASAFVVNGAAQAHDSALVTAGAEARWLNGFSVAATFEGEFSNVTHSYAGKGTLRYQW